MATSVPAQTWGKYLPLGRQWWIRARVAVSWQAVTLCATTAFAYTFFSWATIAQHRAYHSHAYDLSWFDQLAWNTAHGHWLANSFSHGTYLKEHFSPVLFLLGAIYRFHPGPESLLSLQAAFAALAAIPLYLAAAAVLKSRSAGLMIAAAYLVSPHLHGFILFDFHPDIIGVAFIFSSFAFLEARKPRAALVALAPLFFVKEDAALVGIGFAVLFWLYRYRRYARGLLLVSFLYVICVEVVIVAIPHLLHWGSSGEQGRYAYLAKGGVRDPLLVWQHLTGPLQTQAGAYMFGSQALLPLAGPAALIPAADILPHLLADHKPQAQLTLQYPLYPLALLLIASVFNIRAITQSRWAERTRMRLRLPATAPVVALAGAVLLAEGASCLLGSPFGLRFTPERYQTNAHTAALERIVQAVPPGMSVSAQSSILPHLSERTHIREFPFMDYAEYVVIDRNGFRAWQSDVAGYDQILASLPSQGYCLVKEDDGVELYAAFNLCGDLWGP